jgi:hypothetical protein
MRSVQCNVDFGYQLTVCSRTEENNGKLGLSWFEDKYKLRRM